MELVTPDLNPLNEENRTIFSAFRNALEEKEREGKILFLFRGEKYQNVESRLSSSAGLASASEVFGRIFIVGEKARQYSNPETGDERTYLSTINDISPKTLGFIFDRIRNVMVADKLAKRVKKRIPETFKRFFQENSNKSRFVESIGAITDSKRRLCVRDYYLYLLHTSGKSGITKETYFVSTSTERKVARSFSKNIHADKRLIFHYYLPRPYEMHAIAPWMLETQHHTVLEAGLPTYNPAGLFPEQKEVSVKGALFSVFIIGVELVDGNAFVINPNILKLPPDICQVAVSSGIPESETSFEHTIFHTGYTGRVINNFDGNFADARHSGP